MRARSHELDGLLELPSIQDPGARRASFRQALATIARNATLGPSPLDGVSAPALAAAVRLGLESGLFDDLDWLSPSAVGVALYELGAALPNGTEKRDVGRRALARLTEGSAEVFAAIATRMALGSRKGLAGVVVRPRVALLFASSPSVVDAGPLAYAIASRRELAREWIAGPSTGSLPARRLAARILERAAIVAARRAAQGDDYAPRVFKTEAVAPAFARLLADREPLVWRHAAVARGVLAGIVPFHWKSVADALHPRLSPTEWRRAAVSLAAAIATSPERAGPRARDLILGGLPAADPGLIGAMVWGLPRAFEAEPEAAEAVLRVVVETDLLGALEGVIALARDVGGEAAVRIVEVAAAKLARAGGLNGAGGALDDAQRVLIRELTSEGSGEATVRDAVGAALSAYASTGARAAYAKALEAMSIARDTLATLEGVQGDETGALTPVAARAAAALLRDVDAALLEDANLEHLLALPQRAADFDTRQGRPPPSSSDDAASFDDLQDRLGQWLLRLEHRGPGSDDAMHAMSARRLRALLHLVDSEGAHADDDGDSVRVTRIRARRVDVARSLLDRLVRERATPLRRQLCATLARALDALVRDGACDPVDVMLVVGSALREPDDVAMLADASMTPDVEGTLAAYGRFIRDIGADDASVGKSSEKSSEEDPPPPWSRMLPSDARGVDPLAARIEAMLDLAAALGDDVSGRADTLRGALVRMARALRSAATARSRRAVVSATGGGLDTLGDAVLAYAHCEQAARVRVFGADGGQPPSTVAIAGSARLAALLGRLGDPDLEEARAGVGEALGTIRRVLPPAFAAVTHAVLEVALALPLDSSDEPSTVDKPAVVDELPAWLGAQRTIGGFFIVRPLGGGGAASVFVAKRIMERRDARAEQFALKVPDYDGAAARSLSEQEFLDFFRAEASALLGLPPAPNLARFVTFDLAARPKPILVMELIEGPTLERFILSSVGAGPKQRPTLARFLAILDGVLAGLERMHAHAIGHLDVKPSNVILRGGETPALVDFGLSGRHMRPGCATGPYGAPEVWGALPDDFEGQPSPLPADVYAFGALAFEVLTGDTLFDASTEIGIIGKHLSHDGDPPALARLSQTPALRTLLSQALRRDPRLRITVPVLRTKLAAVTTALTAHTWPLGAA